MTIDNLNSRSPSLQLRGILETVVHGYASEPEVDSLRELIKSTRIIGGRTISEYATAAMSILNIEPYSGDDPIITHLIKEMPQFTFNHS